MDSKLRFSKTVDYYVKYRPDYPKSLRSWMESQLGFNPKSIIADIGSGTGKLTQLFLECGNLIYAIEPNDPMREAGEKLMGHFEGFTSISGTAEQTTIPDSTVDFILAGQAFHWFNIPLARLEFQRILKPKGWVLLIWNKRQDDYSDFMRAYNQFLIDHSTDYTKINLRRINEAHFEEFFGTQKYHFTSFDYVQNFDLQGLIGRYLSCSYAYEEGHPEHEKAMQNLKKLYEKYQENENVKMWYKTEVYFGQL